MSKNIIRPLLKYKLQIIINHIINEINIFIAKKMHPIPDGDLLQIHTNKNSLVIRLNLHHEGILSASRGNFEACSNTKYKHSITCLSPQYTINVTQPGFYNIDSIP